MATRITTRDLEAAFVALNREMGTPNAPYGRRADGSYRSNDGCYTYEAAYGGYQLSQIVGESGGVRTFGGFGTKRALYDRIWAMVEGARLAHSADGGTR